MQDFIQLDQPIEASPERIWRGCTQPTELANWQADKVEGRPRLGATLRLHWAALDARADLKIIDWVPQRQVVFQQGETRVKLELGNRMLRLTHSGLDPQLDRVGLTSSWQVSLAQFAHYLERHPGRQRRVQWMLHPLRASAELVYLGFVEPELTRQWLAYGTGLSTVGERFEWQLLAGPQLSGRVIANCPGRDVALTCDQAGEATLVLRTLPVPDDEERRLVALVWSEWGAPTQAGQRIVAALDGCLKRLEKLLDRAGSA